MRAGDPVHCRLEKWGGHPHWSFTGRWLGSDAHGDWLGFPTGTRYERPGHVLTSTNDAVGLVPAPVAGVRPWWLATFHGAGSTPWPSLGGAPVGLYVDVTTPARWQADSLTAVDLDLDVVRAADGGRAVVDDEDEFVEHRARYGYPDDVVAAARASCAALLAAVDGREPPYDGTHRRWLRTLEELSASNGP